MDRLGHRQPHADERRARPRDDEVVDRDVPRRARDRHRDPHGARHPGRASGGPRPRAPRGDPRAHLPLRACDGHRPRARQPLRFRPPARRSTPRAHGPDDRALPPPARHEPRAAQAGAPADRPGDGHDSHRLGLPRPARLRLRRLAALLGRPLREHGGAQRDGQRHRGSGDPRPALRRGLHGGRLEQHRRWASRPTAHPDRARRTPAARLDRPRHGAAASRRHRLRGSRSWRPR